MKDNNIRALIYKHYRTATEVDRAIKWPRQKMSRLIRREQEPTLADILKLSRALNMPWQEVAGVFVEVAGA